MKIGIISSPWFEIPPKTHGGREKMISDLALSLTEQGHEVIVYGISNESSNLQFTIKSPVFTRAQEAHLASKEYAQIESNHILKAYQQAQRDEVDIIHDNTGFSPGILTALAAIKSFKIRTPVLKTCHGIISPEVENLLSLVDETDNFFVNSVSHNQARKIKAKRYVGNIYNFLKIQDYPLEQAPPSGDYFVMLNRVVAGKGVDIAINIAKKRGMKLKIAGRIDQDAASLDYFNNTISPLLTSDIEYVGEVSHQQKVQLLSAAKGYLFPVQWEEPFGLSVIEALACKTPVIAFNKGAMSEIIESGKVGYLVDTEEEMCAKISELETIDPAACRHHVSEKFSVEAMAKRYASLYQSLITRSAHIQRSCQHFLQSRLL